MENLLFQKKVLKLLDELWDFVNTKVVKKDFVCGYDNDRVQSLLNELKREVSSK